MERQTTGKTWQMGGHITGSLAQAGQCFAGKIGTIFVRNFFVGMELKPLLRQSAGTLFTTKKKLYGKKKNYFYTTVNHFVRKFVRTKSIKYWLW